MPLLTPAQFKKLRPHGNYQSYVSYVRAKQQQRGVAPGGGGGFPPNFPKWLRTYFNTDANLGEQAKTIAAGIVDPQVAEINRAAAAKAKQIEGQGLAGKAVSETLGKLFQPIAGEIQGAYQGAADATAGYAQGITGAGAEAAQTAAQEAAGTISRLAPGVGGMTPSAAPAAAATNYYTGGYLPASSLASEAASRMAEASGLGMAGIAAINQQTLSQQGVTRQEMAELQAKGIDIENTRPSETLKALLSLREERRARIGLGMDIWGQTETQKLNAQKAAQEKAAFDLQVKDYMRKSGQDAWAVAKQLSNDSGWVYTVRNGVPVKTNQRTVDWQRQHHTDANARVANRIRQQNANTTQHKAAVAADKTKGTGGLTPNQVLLRENSWMGAMSKQVDGIIRAVKTTNLATGAVTMQPARMPPKKADIVRRIYNVVGPQLAGKIPRWTQPYLKSLIYAYVSTLPNRWWNPQLYKKP